MFTTGYITGGGVRPQHKRVIVSQDRTSQSFAMMVMMMVRVMMMGRGMVLVIMIVRGT